MNNKHVIKNNVVATHSKWNSINKMRLFWTLYLEFRKCNWVVLGGFGQLEEMSSTFLLVFLLLVQLDFSYLVYRDQSIWCPTYPHLEIPRIALFCLSISRNLFHQNQMVCWLRYLEVKTLLELVKPSLFLGSSSHTIKCD